MKDYLEKINKLIEELEAGNAEIKATIEGFKKKESLLVVKEEKLRAIENDVNARMRIVEKHESLENIKASIDKQAEENLMFSLS